MTSSDWNETSGTVVAYFSNGEDAQNAINELVDEGFPVSEIGAAFHGSANASAGATGSPSRPVHDEVSTMGSTASGAGVSGAESDTSGVTPAGLSTGSGTGFSGASRPGPIPGSEIPGNLPREVPSTLRSASTAPLSESTGMGVAHTPATDAPVHHQHHSHEHASWWDKLKHLFSGESGADTSVRRAPVSDASSRKFGTGEGELGITPGHDYPYSGSAFESSFTGMGISQERSRRFATEIRRGGAIVTVNARANTVQAERILQRNNGRIRYESASIADEAWETGPDAARVQVFGRVQRVYPGYVGPGSVGSDTPSRQAS
jgi:hypothetical protein